ncbi:MAG: endonuclease III domain-containing protein [Spirochaetota bacterium]
MSPSKQSRALEVHRRLDAVSPRDITFLSAACLGPFQLLIATLLSARVTDRQVNQVTGALFAAYPTPEALASAELREIEQLIRPVGFYHEKARHIIETARKLVSQHSGQVPQSMAELTELPGVGRKTASVVLGAVYGQPVIIVDTHFSRVLRRLALTCQTYPERIEQEIAELLPDGIQYRFSMEVNLHGRKVCQARRPLCSSCCLFDLCEWSEKMDFVNN